MKKIKITDVISYIPESVLSLKHIEKIFTDAYFLNNKKNVNNTSEYIVTLSKKIESIITNPITKYQQEAIKELLQEEKEIGYIIKNNTVIAIVAFITD